MVDSVTVKRTAIIRFAISLVLLLIVYIPAIQWMVNRWSAAESYYGHGFFIPLISLYVVWQRRELLKKAQVSTDMAGIVFIAVGLLLHVLCAFLKVYFISGVSFVMALYGLVRFCFGREMTKNLIFPLFFLLAMIPLPLVAIGNITVGLKLFAAQCAAFVLNRIGFTCVLDGSTIRMPNSFTVVGEPCSGLRSLISLLTLGLLFAYALNTTYLKKALILLSAVPMAIVSNVARIVLLSVANDLYGEKFATGFFHDLSGFVAFGIAFMGFLAISRMIAPKAEFRL